MKYGFKGVLAFAGLAALVLGSTCSWRSTNPRSSAATLLDGV